ncbi:hypothetical protein TBK1r_02770 [Stieleria magnilauensis]|uniref:Uncharacterized protein n=1 Tax=Stieleria magnilauensis TaxID=2527963 RepID=A0ABX5XHY3_9BACT|nr:hypothetical protein TBK1r_02770 [Planctomycetes bacterium TBK1r]
MPRALFAVNSNGTVDLGCRKVTPPTESNPYPKVGPWTVDLWLVGLRDTEKRGYLGFDVKFGDSRRVTWIMSRYDISIE